MEYCSEDRSRWELSLWPRWSKQSVRCKCGRPFHTKHQWSSGLILAGRWSGAFGTGAVVKTNYRLRSKTSGLSITGPENMFVQLFIQCALPATVGRSYAARSTVVCRVVYYSALHNDKTYPCLVNFRERTVSYNYCTYVVTNFVRRKLSKLLNKL